MNTISQPARHTVLAATLSVVDSAIAQLGRRLPSHVSREDLASAGKVALVEALLRFDGPPADARAYCFTRVRGALLDELRRLDPLSRRARAQVTQMRRAADRLEREHGCAPTAKAVASATGLSVKTIRQLERLAAAADLRSVDETDADGEPVYTLIDEEAACPAETAAAGDASASIRSALNRLPPNHSHVLRRYYLDDCTLETIAAELRVSKERVRQIREAGERKLREDFVVLALWQAFLMDRR